MPKKNNKKSKKRKNNFSKKPLIILLIILSLVFIISKETGIIGIITKNIFFNSFGQLSYIYLSLALIGLLSTYIDRIDNKKTINLCILSGIFFTLIFSRQNLKAYPNLDMRGRISLNNQLANNYTGIGVLGAILSSLLNSIIGIMGINVLAIVCLVGIVPLIFDKNIVELVYSLYNKVGKKSKDLKASTKTREKVVENRVNKFDENRESFSIKKDKRSNIKEDIENYGKPKLNEYKKVDYKDIEQLTLEENKNASDNNNYKFPPLDLLKYYEQVDMDDSVIIQKAEKIEQTLKEFSIDAKVVQIDKGPTVTCFELEPNAGVKVSKIVNLADDLSLALASSGIRIQAPIPGKSVIGLEIENEVKNSVSLKEMFVSEEFQKEKSKMPMALGKDISGKCIISSIDKMPHLLIAGATGSGKSVCINTLIMSIIYKSSPDDVKLILIDPKVVELSIYNNIPHLAIPVVTDPQKASSALNWAVREMERRYEIFSKNHVRDINSYNRKNEDNSLEKLSYIVIIIDELSDLMMVSANDVEDSICRLAQMARACGIHLIIATQRPTVDVITGTIKANIPSRISFAVSSQIDSRTILDQSGAEKLIGKGDMLFYPSSSLKPKRIQGAFVSDEEVEAVVEYLISKNESEYDEEIIEDIDKIDQAADIIDDDTDSLFNEALEIILTEGSASISLLQRKLKIGYARAGRIIDQMEERNIIGPSEGSKPRKILASKDLLERGKSNEYSK
ncbi:MAG: DNA translocase FtsK [Finegoldia sp.]|nr:DNA translocase FtsK [Finegoldia sp.]